MIKGIRDHHETSVFYREVGDYLSPIERLDACCSKVFENGLVTKEMINKAYRDTPSGRTLEKLGFVNHDVAFKFSLSEEGVPRSTTKIISTKDQN